MSDSLKLPPEAWCTREGNIFTIGLTEKIFDTIGTVIEMTFPEPGLELLPGEPIFSISGTNEDWSLKAPVKGYFLEKNEDILEAYHFDNENWVVKFEVISR